MERYPLPEVSPSEVSLLETVERRESTRSYTDQPLTPEEVSTLLWAAQGITHDQGDIPMRAAPSAGATYPLETYLEVPPNGVRDLDPGLYQYDPVEETLHCAIADSLRPAFETAANNQPAVIDAPATIAFVADYNRTTLEYPDHGRRYVHMEAGHAAQNVHLMSEALDLGSCPIGAFDDEAVAEVLNLSGQFDPLYLVTVGEPA